MRDVLARQIGVEVAEAQHVDGQILRVRVLLDQEAERLLGRLVTVLDVVAIFDDEPRGGAFEPLLLDQGEGLVRRILVLLDQGAPGVELAAQRTERLLDAVAGLRQRSRRGEPAGAFGAVPCRPRERRIRHRRHLTVRVGRTLILAEALERLGASERGDVAHAAREALLPALEPRQRQLVEIVAGRILRRREPVDVVAQVPGERGQHLDEVLVRCGRTRRVARACWRGDEGRGEQEREQEARRKHGPEPLAHEGEASPAGFPCRRADPSLDR